MSVPTCSQAGGLTAACCGASAGSGLPLVYDALRKLAAQKLAQEKPGQTLQATALVHEAYLRLVAPLKLPNESASGPSPPPKESDNREVHWNSRGHFFAAAAEAMRRILVEQACKRKSRKGGGGLERPWARQPGQGPVRRRHLQAKWHQASRRPNRWGATASAEPTRGHLQSPDLTPHKVVERQCETKKFPRRICHFSGGISVRFSANL
jgi:hypothetical protein